MNHVILNIIAATVSVFIVGPVVFMAVDREPPYTIISAVIHPDNPLPGEAIEVEWNIQTHRSCAPASNRNVIRQIVDSHNTVWDFDSFPSVYGIEMNVGPNHIVRAFALPPAIAPGPALYRLSVCFVCNPVQYVWPICISKSDIPFTIGMPKPRGPQ